MHPMTAADARFLTPLIAGACFTLQAPSHAVSGFSVSTHWNGPEYNLYMGYGAIIRHDIINDSVVNNTVIYPDSARWPAMNSNGDRVAFLHADNTIIVMDSCGNDVRMLVDSLEDAKGSLDWPEGPWIYYTRGGCTSFGSEQLWRVNAETSERRHVVNFIKGGTTYRVGQWYFSLSSDGRRAAIRTADYRLCDGTGKVLHIEIPAHDLPMDMPLECIDGYTTCGNAISPAGTFVVAFEDYNWDHNVFYVRDFASKAILKKFTIEDINAWAGTDMGATANYSRWSVNSEKWICVMMQRYVDDTIRWISNQVLVNWQDHKAIMISDNLPSNMAQRHDCPGDFRLSCGPDMQIRLMQPAPLPRALFKISSHSGGARGIPTVGGDIQSVQIVDAKGRRLEMAQIPAGAVYIVLLQTAGSSTAMRLAYVR